MLPLSEVKMKLSELVKKVSGRDEVITITRNGKSAAVIVSPDEYESWQETLAIREDKSLMGEIQRGLKGLRKSKRTYTLDELMGEKSASH